MAITDHFFPDLNPTDGQGQAPECHRLQLAGCETVVVRHKASIGNHLPALMLHGIQSHPGWFSRSAGALAAAGCDVYQFQRRGSGTNTLARGHARSPGQLLADLDTAVDHVLRETGADRLHLLGISWGGKYAICYALNGRRARRLGSLTLVAPGLAPRVDVAVTTKLAIAVCALAMPRKTFEIPLSDPALFTDNEAMRRRIRTDPHRLTRATASFLLTSHRMDRTIARAPAGTLTLPVNLLLASADRIVHNGRTRRVLARLTGDRVNVVELAGAHTLEFARDPAPLVSALVEAVGARE